MKKIAIIFIFTVMMFSAGVAGAEKKYLDIGANPVAPRQFDPKTEDVYHPEEVVNR